jgi:hypothetical protein
MVQRNYRMPVELADDLKAACAMLGMEEAEMVRNLVSRFVERRRPLGLAAKNNPGTLYVCRKCGRPIVETAKTKGGVVCLDGLRLECKCTLAAMSDAHMAARSERGKQGAEGG